MAMSANTYLPPSPVVPASLLLSSITNSNPAIVTVLTSNGYIPNQLLYFVVPADYGMTQINGLTAPILAVDGTNLIFTVGINTSFFDVFVNPPSGNVKPASVSPAGSRNLMNFNVSTKTVPFHSLGNVGN